MDQIIQLLDGESVKYRARLSMVKAVVTTIVFVPIACVCLPEHYWWAALFGLLALSGWAEYNVSEIVVTNKRLIARVGLAQPMSLDMQLSKIESVMYKNTISEPNTLVIIGSGGTRETLKYIPKAQELKHQIQVQMDALQSKK